MVSGASFLFNGNFKLHFSCISNQHRSLNLLKPTTAVRMTHHPHPYWASLQADIEAHLKQSIPLKEPLVVFEPMHHLVFSNPQTTVPALCLAACEFIGGQRHQAIAAASALLLMHAASYAHEHLLLTDRPKPNSGPTNVHGPNIELLTGDGIVPLGFELLARSDDQGEGHSDRILRVMVEISRAVGSRGVIEAQYKKKTLGARSDGEELRHVEVIRDVVEKYEGGLHACGAVLGGGSEEEIDRLRKYGFYVGVMQGLLQRGLSEEKEMEEARNLALQELLFFEDKQIDVASKKKNKLMQFLASLIFKSSLINVRVFSPWCAVWSSW